MQESVFRKIKYETTPDKCSHPNIVRLYELGAHSDYGCTCCGMTSSSKEFFRKKDNNLVDKRVL